MGWMPPVAEVIADRWRPGIGDPTVVGWLTVAAYLVAAASCGRAAWREPTPRGSRRAGPSWFWLGLAAAMVLLGINKQLDLQSLLTQVGRQVLRGQGLYGERRHYQALFLGGVAAASLGLLAVALWFARRSLRHRWPALVGLAFVMAFVVARAASFHHVDALLASELGGLRWNWILELGGIAVVVAGALLVRPAGPRDPDRRATAALLDRLYRGR